MNFINKYPLVVPKALAAFCLICLLSLFWFHAQANLIVPVIGASATFAAVWVAIFKKQIELAVARPEVELSYSHDSALVFDKQEWYLFVTVTSTSRNPLIDATLKCVQVTPNTYLGVESHNPQPTTPIPFTWCYWDAFSEMYGEKKRALHRTIYDSERCDLLEIKLDKESGQPEVKLMLAVKPRGQAFLLRPATEYFINCKIYGENYSPEKSWTFRVYWEGEFPADYEALVNRFSIDLVK